MKKRSLVWDAVPEIDQHDIRYSEYTLKSPKFAKSPYEKRRFLEYGFGPLIDCEIDDECTKPDFSSYILPSLNTEKIHSTSANKKLKKTVKKSKQEISLETIYTALRQMKLATIHKIINQSKNELIQIQKSPPNLSHLSVARQLYTVMFNPDQKYWIYMYVRKTLNVPPHVFREVPQIYKILAPEAALIVFQKKYKFDSLNKAAGKLAQLELLDQSFYKNKIAKDLHCRT